MGLSIQTCHEHLSLHCPVTGLKLPDFRVSRNKAHNKRFPINSNSHRPSLLPLIDFSIRQASAQGSSRQQAKAFCPLEYESCCKDKFFFVNCKTNSLFLSINLANPFFRNFANEWTDKFKNSTTSSICPKRSVKKLFHTDILHSIAIYVHIKLLSLLSVSSTCEHAGYIIYQKHKEVICLRLL